MVSLEWLATKLEGDGAISATGDVFSDVVIGISSEIMYSCTPGAVSESQLV